MAEYRYKYTDSKPPKKGNRKPNEPIPWGLIVFLFIIYWPAGLLFLFVKLLSERNNHRNHGQQADQPLGSRTSTAAHAVRSPGSSVPHPSNSKKEPGKGMIVAGSILTAIFGFASLMTLVDSLWMLPDILWLLESVIPPLCFTIGGSALLWGGLSKRNQHRRFRKYQALIGTRQSISVSALAKAMPASHATVCKDLEEMLNSGLLPSGFLNYGSDQLILGETGLKDETPSPTPPGPKSINENEVILTEIRAVNHSIANETLSLQIERIEEITSKIFDYQKAHPNKASQLRTFLNYYLPATLKILHAYARLESQGVEGENISAAMSRIEDMMSKVVEGFEKQLDQLFQTDAMDITSDVAVLERMLSKDGLSSDSGLQLGL